jgi:hypothetical protein
MGHPRLTDEEIDRRGEALYKQSIRPQVETAANIGKLVIIDVETGDYEVDADGLAASDRLLARHPGAALYGERIGYDVAYSFDGVLTRSKQ